MTEYAAPAQPGSLATHQSRYDHWIGACPVVRAAGSAVLRVTSLTYLALGTLVAVIVVGFPVWVVAALLLLRS